MLAAEGSCLGIEEVCETATWFILVLLTVINGARSVLVSRAAGQKLGYTKFG